MAGVGALLTEVGTADGAVDHGLNKNNHLLLDCETMGRKGKLWKWAFSK
jgi:hypothetical protein